MARPKQDLRRVNFNLSSAQYEKYEAAARERGVSLTRYVQQSLFLRSHIDDSKFVVTDRESGRQMEFIYETVS